MQRSDDCSKQLVHSDSSAMYDKIHIHYYDQLSQRLTLANRTFFEFRRTAAVCCIMGKMDKQ